MSTQVVISPRAVTALAVVAAAGVGSVAAYLYLPSATITLTPASQERSIEQEILLSGATEEPDFVRFVLPVRVVEGAVEEQREFVREGAQTFEDFAKGEVVLVNEQSEPQSLLPKTHLRHEATGVFFLTDSPVTIPPAGEVRVSVTAKEKGEAGNVAPGRFSIDKLPASLQQVVYATSNTVFTGGIAVDTPLTEAEINAAKEELRATLRERARGELTAQAGGAAIRDDLSVIEPEHESVSAQIGSAPQSFTITMRMRARAFVVDENDILSLTLLALRSSPSQEEEFASYNPDSFSLEIIRADVERQEATVQGKLTGTFARKIEPSALRADAIAGLSAGQIEEYFRQFPAVSKVDVSLSPFWVTAAPSRTSATEIIVKNVGG